MTETSCCLVGLASLTGLFLSALWRSTDAARWVFLIFNLRLASLYLPNLPFMRSPHPKPTVDSCSQDRERSVAPRVFVSIKPTTLDLYKLASGRQVGFGVAELRQHPARHLPIQLPAHLLTAKFSC